MGDIVDNETQRRFELEEGGSTAFASYRRAGDVVTIPHVEAPPELRGTGTASRLMEGIVRMARAKGFRIVPTCPYAVAWFRRHPEESDVLV